MATKSKVFVSSITELALKLGISRSTLHELQKRDGAPAHGPKGYDLGEWVDFARLHVDKLKAEGGGLVPKTLREKKTAKEIEILDVRLAVMKGDLADVKLTTNTLGRIFSELKAKSYQDGREASVVVQGKGAEEIGRAFSAVLDQLYAGVQEGIDRAENEIQHESLTQLT